MSALREAVLLEMRLRGLATKTVSVYIHAMEELARYYWRPLETLACAEVQAFLDYVISVRKLAWSTVNVYFSAYRFVYQQVLKRAPHQFSIPPRGRSGKRPGVLSRGEVERVIEAPRNIKHRALLAMTYGSGLRVSEVVRVRIADVDRGRMMLRVQQGKGRKDRYTLLSHRALDLLGKLWREQHPAEFFFPRKDGAGPICVECAQGIYYSALRRSGVRHVGGIHVMRHCFVTHLIEAHVDIYTIKRWVGHSALATTAGYVHVSATHQASVRSPLDTQEPEA